MKYDNYYTLTFVYAGFSLSVISIATSPFNKVNVKGGTVTMTSIMMIPAERSKRCQLILHFLMEKELPYSWKYWLELNLVVGPQIAFFKKMLAGLNLANW